MSDADLELRIRANKLWSRVASLGDSGIDAIIESLQEERVRERQRCAAIARHFGGLAFGGTPLTVKETAEQIASQIEDPSISGLGGMD